MFSVLAVDTGWIGVIAVSVLVIGLILGACYGTQAGMIARATTKESIRQPLFPMLIVLGVFFLVMNTFIPMFTFGDDFKLLMDCGLATVLICGLILGVWTSSTSVAAEIEGNFGTSFELEVPVMNGADVGSASLLLEGGNVALLERREA